MTAEPMTDLAERVALALGWKKHPDGHWIDHKGAHQRDWQEVRYLNRFGDMETIVHKRGLPKLDWSIVPVVVDAIREREWCCEWAFDKAGGVARIYPKDEPWVVFREDPDPVVALCEAFVAAQEARQASEQS